MSYDRIDIRQAMLWRWATWAPGFAMASVVPAANYFMGGFNAHVMGATNDAAIVIILIFLMPMAVIWGLMEHRRDLWERMAAIVLLGFSSEIMAWILQRLFYGSWRIGNILERCGTPLADKAGCASVNSMLTVWVWVPGALQWCAAVSMICIASPVLAHYNPRSWFIASVTFATLVWWGMLYTMMGIA